MDPVEPAAAEAALKAQLEALRAENLREGIAEIEAVLAKRGLRLSIRPAQIVVEAL